MLLVLYPPKTIFSGWHSDNALKDAMALIKTVASTNKLMVLHGRAYVQFKNFSNSVIKESLNRKEKINRESRMPKFL